MRQLALAAAFTFVVSSVPGGAAPRTGSLTGRVLLGDGSPVAQALVESDCCRALTDAAGWFRFDVMWAGPQAVFASSEHGRAGPLGLVIEAGRTGEVELVIPRPSELVPLEPALNSCFQPAGDASSAGASIPLEACEELVGNPRAACLRRNLEAYLGGGHGVERIGRELGTGSDLPGPVAALIATVQGPDPERAHRAAVLLGWLEPGDAASLAALAPLLEDGRLRVRAAAARILDEIDTESSRPILARAMGDEARWMARWTAETLAASGATEPEVVAAWLGLAWSLLDLPEQVDEALHGPCGSGDGYDFAACEEDLWDEWAAAPKGAIEALTELGSPAARTELSALLAAAASAGDPRLARLGARRLRRLQDR